MKLPKQQQHELHQRSMQRMMAVMTIVLFVLALVGGVIFFITNQGGHFAVVYDADQASSTLPLVASATPILDREAYDAKLLFIAHIASASTTASGTPAIASTTKHLWPVHAPYPNYGALLPFSRIVAYYGNFYAKGMGVLGENDASTTRTKLLGEVAKWNAADPKTPAIPAVDYIAISAQADSGFDGKYRARMPYSEMQKAVDLARSMNGITIFDLQVGQSDLSKEVPLIKQFLEMPDVHLAIDPEFDMQEGKKPGTVIGTMDADDINWVARYLAGIVRENHLPPKVLVVHRFTENMVTNWKKITPLPEVEIVMDMDGWGPPQKKIGTYNAFIYPEPVQFTGLKLFYKNDLFAPSTRMLSLKEVLGLTPSPLFIQYQ